MRHQHLDTLQSMMQQSPTHQTLENTVTTSTELAGWIAGQQDKLK